MKSVISEVEICGHAIVFSRIRSSIVSTETIAAPENVPLVRAGSSAAVVWRSSAAASVSVRSRIRMENRVTGPWRPAHAQFHSLPWATMP